MIRHSVCTVKVTALWSLFVSLGVFGFAFLPLSHTVGTPSRSDSISIPDNVEPIYSSDPNDPWNRIFHLLFTRTLKVDVSSDFPEAGPFVSAEAMAVPGLRISTRRFERTEIADRAIEPLYPSFFSNDGVKQVLTEPHFSQLKQALGEAINERTARSITARALMQMDVWAAYDVLFAHGNIGDAKNRQQLHLLLAQFIRKLALSEGEIQQLKSNFSVASKNGALPNLFAEDSGWIEVQLRPQRLHDHSADFRRAARVFLRPRQIPQDKVAFVEGLKFNRHIDQIDAVALIIQNLLIDKNGHVRASPLISAIQVRKFLPDRNRAADVKEFELARKMLLRDPRKGGFMESDNASPSYLAASGNDYGFATPLFSTKTPVLAQLHTRCAQCHGASQRSLLTFATHDPLVAPPAAILDAKGNDRTSYVAAEKEKRDDYKSLMPR